MMTKLLQCNELELNSGQLFVNKEYAYFSTITITYYSILNTKAKCQLLIIIVFTLLFFTVKKFFYAFVPIESRKIRN